jgi:hypothetical protein
VDFTYSAFATTLIDPVTREDAADRRQPVADPIVPRRLRALLQVWRI